MRPRAKVTEGATGWPATDWYEDYVLRIGGTELYDQWVSHEVPFDDPQIEEAGRLIEEIWFTEGNVFGGRKAIASTSFKIGAMVGRSARPQEGL